jgi:adenylyl-sulfate kinase
MAQRTRALVACMPKSGSTFLSSIISSLPGFRQVSLVPDHGRREQELCVDTLRKQEEIVGQDSWVAQHHVRYSEATKHYLQEFKIRPIVLVRNIFDVVPSLVDHHALEGPIYPAAFAPSDIATRSIDEQSTFVTQMALPWYFNFYMSWLQCPNRLEIRYEDLVGRPEWVTRRVCDYLEIEVSNTTISAAIALANSSGRRKNKVTPGRGKYLSSENTDSIIRMANQYPGEDFSSIGITDKMRGIKQTIANASARRRVYWLTGLSGAGKSTLARAVKNQLDRLNVPSVILDGDELRAGINADLGFSETDRTENVRRVAEIASLFGAADQVVIVAVISPTPAQRAMARDIIGEGFVQVFVDTPLDVCESRDPKGHYRRARQGRLAGFTGVSSRYVPPHDADVRIQTTITAVEEAVEQILSFEGTRNLMQSEASPARAELPPRAFVKAQ